MNKLFIFGCSYSAEFTDESVLFSEYKKFRGGNYPKIWGEILSEKLDLEMINYAKGGSGNDEIFDTICKNSHKINKNDLVIISWSYMHRFRWATSGYKDWINLSAHFSDGHEKFISRSTNEEISISRTHPLYYKQIANLENIIITLSEAVGFDVYFWNADYNVKYNFNEEIKSHKHYLCLEYITSDGVTIFNEIFKRGGQRIKEETNDVVFDYHMGETGHQTQAELFYNDLIRKKQE